MERADIAEPGHVWGAGRLTAVFGGQLAALVQPSRVIVLALPSLLPYAELGIEGDHESTDVAFTEDGTRIVVVARAATLTQLHAIDPTGPDKVGDLVLRGAARLVAVAGSHAVLATATATHVVDLAKLPLTTHVLPLRAPLAAAARVGATRLLVASSGSIEEWDIVTRAPAKRLRVDRPIDPVGVGGNPQRIWMVLRNAPRCVDIISLANRSTRRIELPEELVHAIPHPSGDLLVSVGASRTAYLLDLARERAPITLDCGPVWDAAWLGPTSLLANPVEGRLAIVSTPVFGRTTAPAFDVPDAGELDDAPAEVPAPEGTPGPQPPEASVPRPMFETSPPPVAREPAADDADLPLPALERIATLSPAIPDLPRSGGWRGDLVAWARGVKRAAPERSPLTDLVARLQLEDVRHAVGLLYAARLVGNNGVSIAELASVLAWKWDVALGAGPLAACGIARLRGERWHLVDEVAAHLDDRPPLAGVVVPGLGTSPANVAIVADEGLSLEQVARAAAPRVGSLFVPNARGERRPAAFMLEARVRGVIPLVPWERFRSRVGWPELAAIVVSLPERAHELGIPIVATV